MIDFLVAYSTVTNSLSNLLGMRFFPGTRDSSSAIGLTLEAILRYHNSGNVLARDVQLNRMALLAKHLKEIHEFDKSLSRDFKKTIKRSRNINEFFGIRFEINITATLIRHKIPFEKTESPDISIDFQFGKAAIECTSARLRKEKDHYNLLYKIESAIRSKSKKEYSNLHTALFLDITNLVYEILNAGTNLSKLLDRDILFGIVRIFNFGNLTLFTYLSDIKRGGIESAYTRIDHPQIESGLASLLGICFPFGSPALHEFAVPEEG